MNAQRSIFWILAVSLWWASAASSADGPGSAGGLSSVAAVPAFTLVAPSSPGEREYLGLSAEGAFHLSQINARVVLVEVFSFYCPHCQRAAPQVNVLFRRIEERPDTRGVIKLIGIGAGNSPYEVGQFKEKYEIRFPLFSDEDLDVTKMLGVKVTPTFVGIVVTRDGNQKRIYFRDSGFEDPDQVLSDILKSYEIEMEKKP